MPVSGGSARAPAPLPGKAVIFIKSWLELITGQWR